ncbi:MBOAT family O-acyltransferase [Helicobacter sp.]|uniref:MBOAT family O-acyltransferase n=1 Tax=Helicobacter sp. TaxID=218 RepID=UPI0025B7D49F|nr:MBOAT family O-acyltransferase [Helicobacter sp.]
MLFNSYLFIFCFLPIVWAGFHILKALNVKKGSATYMNLAKIFLVLSSLFFYAYWKLIYLPILLGSIVINYFLAQGIIRSFAKQIIDCNGGGGESCKDSACSDKGLIASRSLQLHTPSMRPCERSQSKPFSSTSLESQAESEKPKTRRSRSFFSKSHREQVALESTQAIESKQITGDSKIVEKNTENVFCSQLVGGRIFDEKAELCSGEQGDKTCGLSPQGDTNSLLYRKKPTPEPSQAESLTTQKLSAKTLLTLGIIFNLCLLGVFKYTDFFLENFNLFSKLLHLDFTIPLPHILLPLALSFVTFQQIAFLVDCYKQSKVREETQRLESNVENHRESQSQHSLTQATLSTTTAKEKMFILSPLPLAQKRKATAFLFYNQGESLAISTSSTQAAMGTTAYHQSAFEHHEAGENRCAFGVPNGLDSANAESQKPIQESIHINFLDYCLFITFFPQLIAGPIVHHREMMPQFYKMSRRDSACSDKAGSLSFACAIDAQVLSPRKSLRNPAFSSTILESQTKNKPTNDSRISKETSAIAERYPLFCDEKSGLSSDWQGSCLDGNDRRQSRRIADLSRKAESTKKAESLHIINWEYIAKGLFIFSIGLFKKVVIADSFAKWANTGFSAVENGAVLNCLESWAVSLSYTFQLYFDFSGYCDMAIGLGLLFGIVLPINFNSPYKALNIATFWRRWHITLGRFLKEYLYIPLGGNQNIKRVASLSKQSSKLESKQPHSYRESLLNNLLTLRNLFIVAFLSGVWHGSGWGFVIWGSLHGMAMMVHRIYMLMYKKLDSASLYVRFMQTRIYILLCWILTFNFINIAWVFFRAENVQGAINLLQGMFCGEVVLPKSLESKFGALSEWGVEFGVMWIANVVKFESSIFMVIFLAAGFVITLFLRNSCEIASNLRLRVYSATFCAILLSISLCYIGGNDYSAFLYFNF